MEERLTKKKPRAFTAPTIEGGEVEGEDECEGATKPKPTRGQIRAAINACTEVLEPIKGRNGKDYMGVFPDNHDPKKFKALIRISGFDINKCAFDSALDAACWYARARFVASTYFRDGKAKSDPNSKLGRKRAAHNSTRSIVGPRKIAIVTTLSIVREPGFVIQHESGQQNIEFEDLRESDLLMGRTTEAASHAATIAFRAKLLEQFCGETPSTTTVDDYINELVMTTNVRFMVKRSNKLWGNMGGAKYVLPRIKSWINIYQKKGKKKKVASTNDDDYM